MNDGLWHAVKAMPRVTSWSARRRALERGTRCEFDLYQQPRPRPSTASEDDVQKKLGFSFASLTVRSRSSRARSTRSTLTAHAAGQ